MSSMSGQTGFSQKLRGTGMRSVSLPTMNQGQQDIFNQIGSSLNPQVSQLMGQIGSLAGGGNEQDWQKLEAPAMRQFGALQGNMGSRFSGMGGSGSRNSSGFQNQMGEAGASLAEQLQSQRMGFQTQAQQQMMQMIQMLLGKDTMHQGFVPEKIPFWKQLAVSGAGGLAQAGSGLGQLGLAKKFGLI